MAGVAIVALLELEAFTGKVGADLRAAFFATAGFEAPVFAGVSFAPVTGLLDGVEAVLADAAAAIGVLAERGLLDKATKNSPNVRLDSSGVLRMKLQTATCRSGTNHALPDQ